MALKRLTRESSQLYSWTGRHGNRLFRLLLVNLHRLFLLFALFLSLPTGLFLRRIELEIGRKIMTLDAMLSSFTSIPKLGGASLQKASVRRLLLCQQLEKGVVVLQNVQLQKVVGRQALVAD